jgi:hypothetical protein
MRRTLTFTIRMVAALAFLATPLSLSAGPELNAGIEEKVRAAFADAPDMAAVARCESGYRQFASDGAVLRGGPGGRYVGIFQIDEPLHSVRAAGMGLDILTVDGNIGFARVLYDESGIRPWRGCAPAAPSVAAGAAGPVTATLRLGMRHPQIIALQKVLNASGAALAASGPGSPGNETDYFGPLTRDAVRRFQCAKGIVCAGDESTTGYGLVGPRTRAALNGTPR